MHAPIRRVSPKGDTLNDKRRRFRMLLLATLCAAFLSGPGAGAFAQAYHNRPIHIIAPFPAGGGYDFLSRLIGAEMSKTFGQPVVVENKAGANGNIGTDAAAKSAPDGYTVLMGGNSPLALNVGLYPKLPYDPVKDFETISRVATQPNLLAAHPKVPAKTVAELIQYAKANPAKLNAETLRILNLPELRERTRSQGIELAGTTPEQFSAFLRADIAKWTQVIREFGIPID